MPQSLFNQWILIVNAATKAQHSYSKKMPANMTAVNNCLVLHYGLFPLKPLLSKLDRLIDDTVLPTPRLSTGAPLRTASRASGCPSSTSGTGSGLPWRRSPACAARLHTRMFATLRLSLPLGGRPPVRAALPLRTPNRLPDDMFMIKRRANRELLVGRSPSLFIRYGESDLGNRFLM